MTLELIAFLIIALITLLSAISVISSKEIFHSALFLALMLLGVAGLFIMLNAEFLAAIQVLIYAGAIIVLILFAIMLTKREVKEESRGE
jgi:NADH-quinone oxidoreductase subunit J